MRLSLLAAFGITLLAAAAQAQNTAPVTPAPSGLNPSEPKPSVTAPGQAGTLPARAQSKPAVTHHRHRRTLQAMFERANATHDGHLTPEQAQASWPSVARHFAEIDKDNRGYLTIEQIRTWRKAHRHHRHGHRTRGSAATSEHAQ